MRLSELAKPTEHKLLGQDVEVGNCNTIPAR